MNLSLRLIVMLCCLVINGSNVIKIKLCELCEKKNHKVFFLWGSQKKNLIFIIQFL